MTGTTHETHEAPEPTEQTAHPVQARADALKDRAHKISKRSRTFASDLSKDLSGLAEDARALAGAWFDGLRGKVRKPAEAAPEAEPTAPTGGADAPVEPKDGEGPTG